MSFTKTSLIPNAGLLPAAVLAQRIGLSELIDLRLQLARHGANSGAKASTVIGSMLAGGDSIDDTALLRAGATGELFDATWRPRRSGRGCGHTSGPTCASSTRSAVSCWSGCGPPAWDRATCPDR